MPNEVILDASAVLAVLKREPGAERVRAVLDRAAIGAVNAAEVQSKLVDLGLSRHAAEARIRILCCPILAFSDVQAIEAGSLIALTRSLGLSLGDRACLALAIDRKATVYTTDRIWTKLDLGIQIEAIR
ncbi:MAG: type II toxin-antitoxin system VapC family toxin [Terracidiphilus sp.]